MSDALGVLRRPKSWQSLSETFAWPTPKHFNIAEFCVDRWARSDPDRVALTHVPANGDPINWSYEQLSKHSNALANAFSARGLKRGDRCAVFLPQCPEVILTHMACYKLNAIVLPLFTLFGTEALEFRLRDSGASAIVTDAANLPKILTLAGRLPALKLIYCIDPSEALDFHGDIANASDRFEVPTTDPETPAILLYTSGTTGPPKGALHAHRVLFGHLPGVQTHHDFLPQKGDCLWTPADWAWIGGMINVMLPALFLGVPLISHRMAKFDPDAAVRLIQKYHIQNAFMPPTALKMMQANDVSPVKMRSIGSGGESLGAALLDWGKQAFGVTINEFYGQTECNLVVGNCSSLFPPKAGSMGRVTPGSRIAILDEVGREVPTGQVGEIGLHKSDFSMFLGYWNAPEQTAQKFAGEYLRSGDLGAMDEDGYVFFKSRTDDIISSAGYRIGPTEIENCLMTHPNVTMAAVIGVPDAVKGQVVKAHVTIAGSPPSTFEADLIALVRNNISPHATPKEIEVVDCLPLTATGKILRKDLRERHDKYTS